MKQVFDFHEPYYNLCSETSQFRRENTKTRHYGIPSVKFLAPKIWAAVPQNIKNCKSLQESEYGNPKLALAECAKSTLQILVSFD